MEDLVLPSSFLGELMSQSKMFEQTSWPQGEQGPDLTTIHNVN